MAWLDGVSVPMEVIPEEGEDLALSSSLLHHPLHNHTVSRKTETFTSEQLDTLVSTLPRHCVPHDWLIEEEIVDPSMAATYVTEELGGALSARGTTYSYTYESHYDIPPPEITTLIDPDETRHTHKVTRVSKVTTTRSLRQIPLESPYDEVFFDADGRPTALSRVTEVGDVDDLGIPLSVEKGVTAPPPAPPIGNLYRGRRGGEAEVPGQPHIFSSDEESITLRWARSEDPSILGYHIEMRDYPSGEWERVHDHLLREPSCTIRYLEASGHVQLRVLGVSREGVSAPSLPSAPIHFNPPNIMPSGSSSVPLACGRPIVVGVDGSRASIEWTPPPLHSQSPPLLGYQVEYRVYGTSDWIVANDSLITHTRYHVENLRPNGVYEFRVAGRNEEGVGVASPPSAPAHIKPAVPLRASHSRHISNGHLLPPSQPYVVESDVNWVKLEWAEVERDVQYIVELREVGDPTWCQANEEPIHTNSIQVEGLRPGSTYEFRVMSYASGLVSLPSEVSDVVSLRPLWKSMGGGRAVPSPPSAPEVMECVGDTITLCWQPAHSALPVLGYDVEFRDSQQDSGWYKVNDTPMTTCKMTVGDLIVGHEYEFRVIAMNGVGMSEASSASAPITINPLHHGEGRFVEAERFGAIRLLQEEMMRESPPLPDRDDSPPPIHHRTNNNYAHLAWRDPNLREVIEYLGSGDKEKQRNASGYLQHLTYSDQNVKDETRELGGIVKLVALLRSDDARIVRNACACLKNLCYEKQNDANKMALLECDGVPLLSAVIATALNDERAKEATGALWNLSSCDPLKKPILQHAAQPLAHIVTSPLIASHKDASHDAVAHFNTSLFKNATGVLRNISAADSSSRMKLRSMPLLVDTLIRFLTISIQRNHVDSSSVENTVCLLRNLSYRIQEVEDSKYNGNGVENGSGRSRSKSAPSGSPKVSKKSKKEKKAQQEEPVQELSTTGVALLWQPSTVRLYLKLLQEASNLVTLEACAGAIQNLAACEWNASAQVRTAVRVEKGLPVLVELVRLTEDNVVCAVATALRNLSVDERNRELIGKFALRDLLEKLPDANSRRSKDGPSDHTIAAVLGIVFEIVRSSAALTREVHEAKGTERLRALAKAYPAYSHRVCKYASQVLYMMWQHKELHDGFKRSGLKEADFYAGSSAKKGEGGDHSATLARPISSQGRERPRRNENNPLNDTLSSEHGYGTMRDDYTQPHRTPSSPLSARSSDWPTSTVAKRESPYTALPPPSHALSHYQSLPYEPVYASVRKNNGEVDDSWV